MPFYMLCIDDGNKYFSGGIINESRNTIGECGREEVVPLCSNVRGLKLRSLAQSIAIAKELHDELTERFTNEFSDTGLADKLLMQPCLIRV